MVDTLPRDDITTQSRWFNKHTLQDRVTLEKIIDFLKKFCYFNSYWLATFI